MVLYIKYLHTIVNNISVFLCACISSRSKPSEVEKAKELWKTITLKGNEAFDKFVEVLLESGTQTSLGELLQNARNEQGKYCV